MNENHAALPATDMEPDIGNAPLGEEEIKRFNTPVRIHIHSKRKRLADCDGISGKAALDGLVACRLLWDDSTEYVKEVTHSQEKTKGPEVTEITITALEDPK